MKNGFFFFVFIINSKVETIQERLYRSGHVVHILQVKDKGAKIHARTNLNS